MRLIDADSMKADLLTVDPQYEGMIQWCITVLDAQPTIERKMGEWEEIEVIPEAYDIAGVKTWASKMRCNQCGFTTFAIEGKFAQYDFCPNCGADMRTKEMDYDYERAIEQLEHNILYEPTFNQDDGSM